MLSSSSESTLSLALTLSFYLTLFLYLPLSRSLYTLSLCLPVSFLPLSLCINLSTLCLSLSIYLTPSHYLSLVSISWLCPVGWDPLLCQIYPLRSAVDSVVRSVPQKKGNELCLPYFFFNNYCVCSNCQRVIIFI